MESIARGCIWNERSKKAKADISQGGHRIRNTELDSNITYHGMVNQLGG